MLNTGGSLVSVPGFNCHIMFKKTRFLVLDCRTERRKLIHIQQWLDRGIRRIRMSIIDTQRFAGLYFHYLLHNFSSIARLIVLLYNGCKIMDIIIMVSASRLLLHVFIYLCGFPYEELCDNHIGRFCVVCFDSGYQN